MPMHLQRRRPVVGQKAPPTPSVPTLAQEITQAMTPPGVQGQGPVSPLGMMTPSPRPPVPVSPPGMLTPPPRPPVPPVPVAPSSLAWPQLLQAPPVASSTPGLTGLIGPISPPGMPPSPPRAGPKPIDPTGGASLGIRDEAHLKRYQELLARNDPARLEEWLRSRSGTDLAAKRAPYEEAMRRLKEGLTVQYRKRGATTG